MNATQSTYAAPGLKASDADRDAVVAQLSEQFQAGRLTSDELEERTGQALAARTYGELAALTSDLPAPAVAPSAASPAAPARPGGLLVIGIVAVMLIASVAFGVASGWRHEAGLWWLIPVVLIAARRLALGAGPARRRIRRY